MRWFDDYAVGGCSGQERTRHGFLWWPMKLQGDGRWLERATWVEQFGTDWTVHPNGWHAFKWAQDEPSGAPPRSTLSRMWAWVRAQQYDYDLTIGEVIDAHLYPYGMPDEPMQITLTGAGRAHLEGKK